MIDFSSVFLYNEQPDTCPKCGLRSEIILDLSHTIKKTTIQRCLGPDCDFEFVMEEDLAFSEYCL